MPTSRSSTLAQQLCVCQKCYRRFATSTALQSHSERCEAVLAGGREPPYSKGAGHGSSISSGSDDKSTTENIRSNKVPRRLNSDAGDKTAKPAVDAEMKIGDRVLYKFLRDGQPYWYPGVIKCKSVFSNRRSAKRKWGHQKGVHSPHWFRVLFDDEKMMDVLLSPEVYGDAWGREGDKVTGEIAPECLSAPEDVATSSMSVSETSVSGDGDEVSVQVEAAEVRGGQKRRAAHAEDDERVDRRKLTRTSQQNNLDKIRELSSSLEAAFGKRINGTRDKRFGRLMKLQRELTGLDKMPLSNPALQTTFNKCGVRLDTSYWDPPTSGRRKDRKGLENHPSINWDLPSTSTAGASLGVSGSSSVGAATGSPVVGSNSRERRKWSFGDTPRVIKPNGAKSARKVALSSAAVGVRPFSGDPIDVASSRAGGDEEAVASTTATSKTVGAKSQEVGAGASIVGPKRVGAKSARKSAPSRASSGISSAQGGTEIGSCASPVTGHSTKVVSGRLSGSGSVIVGAKAARKSAPSRASQVGIKWSGAKAARKSALSINAAVGVKQHISGTAKNTFTSSASSAGVSGIVKRAAPLKKTAPSAPKTPPGSDLPGKAGASSVTGTSWWSSDVNALGLSGAISSQSMEGTIGVKRPLPIKVTANSAAFTLGGGNAAVEASSSGIDGGIWGPRAVPGTVEDANDQVVIDGPFTANTSIDAVGSSKVETIEMNLLQGSLQSVRKRHLEERKKEMESNGPSLLALLAARARQRKG